MPERVLVTGATGFVGRHLVEALRAASFEVICHSRNDGDISRCALAYDDVGYVFHLAARQFVPDSWRLTREFYDTNVLGTINVLEFCRRHKCPVTVMSSYIYGQPRYLPIDERHPVEGFNPYAHSKILAEGAASFYAKQFGLKIAVIRPFNLYGPGQGASFLIPSLVNQALEAAETIKVLDPRPRRDFLHVRDLVTLLLLLAKNRGAGVYNAGTGTSYSIADVVEAINLKLPKPKTLIWTGDVRDNEVLDTIADCSKAATDFGWTAQVPLPRGIAELVESTAVVKHGAARL